MHQRQRAVERNDRWVKPDAMLINKLDEMNRHIKNFARREGVPTFSTGDSGSATRGAQAYTDSQTRPRFEDAKDANNLPEEHPRILQYLYDKIEQEDWSVPRAWHAYDNKIRGEQPTMALASEYLASSELDTGEGKVLKMQLSALIQCVAGLGGCVFNWSVGLDMQRRKDLADLIVDYVNPCQHIHTSLELLCFELGTLQISDNERPSKGVQTVWHWTTLPEDAFEDYAADHQSGQGEFDHQSGHGKFVPEAESWADQAVQDGIIHDWSEAENWYDMVQEPFVVDNSLLQAKGKGLGYRVSPDLEDRDGNSFHPWGTMVLGSRVGHDWLCVQGRWLPMVHDGVSVIYRLDDQTYAEMSAPEQIPHQMEPEPQSLPSSRDALSLNEYGSQLQGKSTSYGAEVAQVSARTEQPPANQRLQLPGHSPLRGAKRVSVGQGKQRLQ